MIKIGLVLPNTPGYSETFFVSKIKGLSESGYQLILFARRSGTDLSWLPKGIRGVEPYAVLQNPVLQLLKTVFVLTWLFIKAPVAAKNFVTLERQDGISTKALMRRLYINAHILPYRLDWLHFGFATMGLDKENTAKAIGARAAVSFRGYDISRYPLKHKGCYHKLFSKIDRVHSISDYLYKLALSHGLPPSTDYYKITPAIAADKFKDGNREYVLGDKINILTVGRLSWVKGYDYALQALSQLNIDFQYTIIGDGEDRERLLFAAYQLGIADKVVFAGKQAHDKIVHYMRESAIYLQSSVQEGFCNAVLEAQAAGLICIVSDAEGLPENVEHNRSGFVVPKRSPEALVRQITTVLAMDPAQRRQMSAYTARRVREQFDLKQQIDQFIKFYA